MNKLESDGPEAGVYVHTESFPMVANFFLPIKPRFPGWGGPKQEVGGFREGQSITSHMAMTTSLYLTQRPTGSYDSILNKAG